MDAIDMVRIDTRHELTLVAMGAIAVAIVVLCCCGGRLGALAAGDDRGPLASASSVSMDAVEGPVVVIVDATTGKIIAASGGAATAFGGDVVGTDLEAVLTLADDADVHLRGERAPPREEDYSDSSSSSSHGEKKGDGTTTMTRGTTTGDDDNREFVIRVTRRRIPVATSVDIPCGARTSRPPGRRSPSRSTSFRSSPTRCGIRPWP